MSLASPYTNWIRQCQIVLLLFTKQKNNGIRFSHTNEGEANLYWPTFPENCMKLTKIGPGMTLLFVDPTFLFRFDQNNPSVEQCPFKTLT